MNESLEVAEQAIAGAWFQGNEVELEQAQLWIAAGYRRAEVRAQRQRRKVEEGVVRENQYTPIGPVAGVFCRVTGELVAT